MTPFKFGDQTIHITSGWHEVTIEQFIEFAAMKDDSHSSQLLGIFSDKPRRFWFDSISAPDTVIRLTQALSWLKKAPDFFAFPVPDEIVVGEKKLKVPKDLAALTFGQSENFWARCMVSTKNEKGEKIVTAKDGFYATALAVYLQPLYTGKKFTDEGLDDFIQLCSRCLIIEGFPVANFFLEKYFGLNPRRRRLVIPPAKDSPMQESDALQSTEQ